MLCCFILLGSCSTGIESTKTITLSKEEKKVIGPTPEDEIMLDLQAPQLGDWEKGKRFLITDSKAAFVFEPLSVTSPTLKQGDIIRYEGFKLRTAPGGEARLQLIFSNNGINYEYSTGRDAKSAENLTSLDIPLTVDLELVAKAREKLNGRQVWTRSALWYDEEGEKITGRQFVPVTVKDVMVGDSLFPLHILISDEMGNPAYLYMNLNNTGLESRSFRNIFFLSDPRQKHPGIRDDVWELICLRKVKEGMTKEECKLALGNPTDVNSGHDWNQTIDLWRYENGAFLQFQDGLLVSFRI